MRAGRVDSDTGEWSSVRAQWTNRNFTPRADLSAGGDLSVQVTGYIVDYVQRSRWH